MQGHGLWRCILTEKGASAPYASFAAVGNASPAAEDRGESLLAELRWVSLIVRLGTTVRATQNGITRLRSVAHAAVAVAAYVD